MRGLEVSLSWDACLVGRRDWVCVGWGSMCLELPCGRSRLSVCFNGDPGVQTVEKKSKVTYHLAREPHP